MTTTVVLADDHPLILDALEQLLAMENRYRVVARCLRGDDCIDAIREHRPDVAVIDVRMPGASGMSVLAEAGRGTKVILLTASISDEEIASAMEFGAWGLILKERAADQLIDCLGTVVDGERWIDPELASRGLRAARSGANGRPRGPLSAREIEITRLVAEGCRNKEIAERLEITEGTVKTHLRTIFEKIEVESRVALVNWARKRGVV